MSSLQERFDAAVTAQGEGRFDEAEAGFRAVLAQSPDEGAALFGLGLTLMGARRFLEAVPPLEQAAAEPDAETIRQLCLGQAYFLTGAFDRAAATFQASAEIEALTAGARQTWARSATYAAVTAIGAEAALDLGQKIAEPDAEDIETVAREGFSILVAFGRLDAARAFGQWLEARRPEDLVRNHELRVLTDPEIDRAPAAYVEALFDDFAERFDHQLVENLDYRAPEILAAMIARAGARFSHVLDLGCGTGLAAPHLRRFSDRLTGVDLSAAMLAKARARGGYDDLIQAEAVVFLSASQPKFDLIVAADVFSYFGDLASLIAATAASLAKGGVLAFSVELGEDGWSLLPSARYAHADAYIRGLSAPWFEVLDAIETPLRRDAATTTRGGLYIVRKVRD